MNDNIYLSALIAKRIPNISFNFVCLFTLQLTEKPTPSQSFPTTECLAHLPSDRIKKESLAETKSKLTMQ